MLPSRGSPPAGFDSSALEPSLFDFLPSASGLDWVLDERDPDAPGPLRAWQGSVLGQQATASHTSSASLEESHDAFEGMICGLGPARESEDSQGQGQVQGEQPGNRNLAKEKNRKAQKLFRERSKQRQKENEERLNELAVRVRRLETEKASVEARNLILEQLVRLNAPHALQQSLSSLGDLRQDMLPVSLLHPRMGWRRQQLTREVHLSLGSAAEPDLILSPRAAKEMGWATFSALWKVFVNKLAGCLNVLADGAQEEEVIEDVQGLMNEATGLMAYLALHNPRMMQMLQSLEVEGGDQGGVMTPNENSTWKKLKDILILSDHQIRDLLAARKRYLQEMDVVMSNRARICTAMEALPHVTLGTRTWEEGKRSLVLLAGVNEQLQGHVDETHGCICTFMEFCWKKVLNPVQAAKFVVSAFPYGPDMMTAVHTLAAEAGGEPVASSLMLAPAASHVLTAIAPGSAYNHPSVGNMISSGVC